MKTVLLVACLAVITIPASAQSKPSENGGDNLYSLALKASILEMEKNWGNIDDSGLGERVRTDYHHLIVQKDPLITEGLPTNFDNHFVEYLDSSALIDRYKKAGKSYATLAIQPIKNQSGALKIGVIVYWVSYQHRHLQLGLSDWSNVEFRYDCGTQQFVMSSVKLGGI